MSETLYKMFQFYRNSSDRVDLGEEGWLQTSPDGVHWSRPVVTTHVGDNTSFFHNPFRGKWCMSVRRGFEAIGADGLRGDGRWRRAGSLTTRPLSFSGAHLFVNVACADGELRVEILDERGGLVPGYAAADSVPLVGDSTRHRMAWKGDVSLARFARRPVAFGSTSAGALYAFWVSGTLRGESSGYVAAGGPDFDGPTDAHRRPV